MRTARLFIIKDNKECEIDLFDNVVIPITLKVSDIKTFGQKNSSFSSDFTIPHTNNNAVIFGIVDELNAYNATFEFGKNYEAYVTMGGLTTFSGQFRLKKVFKERGGAYSYYVGCLFSESKSFVDSLGTETLTGNDDYTRDLDFSEYDTAPDELHLADFVQKLQTRDGVGYGWGLTLIDKTNKASQSFSSGTQSWYADECTPYLFVTEIWMKIFSKAGYNYVSDFLDESNYLQNPQWADTIGKYHFWDIIYPYMPSNTIMKQLNPVSTVVEQVDEDSSTDLVSGNMYASWPADEFDVLNGTNPVWTVNFDSSLYSITNNVVDCSLGAWRFVCPTLGQYSVSVNIPFQIRCKWWSDYLNRYLNSSEMTENDMVEHYTYYVQLQKNNRGLATVAQQQDYPQNFTIDASGYTMLSDELSLTFNQNMTLLPGDVIQIYCWIGMQCRREYWSDLDQQYHSVYAWWDNKLIPHPVYPRNLSVHVRHNEDRDELINITQQDGFYEGNPFYPNSILNPKTTKIDFFNSIMRMFNLYVEDVSGKFNYSTGKYYPPKTLRIEPYELYYEPEINYGSNIKDWTDKIDWNTVEYRRVDDYLYNVQKFCYSDNKDFYTNHYNDTYLTPYGQLNKKGIYCTDATNINEIKPNSGIPVCGVVNNATDSLQCPKAFSLNNNGQLDIKKEFLDNYMFIWNNNMLSNTTTGLNFTARIQSRLSSAYTDITKYYCADTLNDGYGNDTASLLWATPQSFYQNTNGKQHTNNNLYTAFYMKQYNAYTAPDSRIMRANIYLTAFDIATVQLSDTIVIKDNKWHILEIKQWKNEKESCEIELIKVLPYDTDADEPTQKNKKQPIDDLPIPA